MESIRNTVRAYILSEFLQGEAPENLADDTPLISSGILDSLGTLKLVAFLEEKYEIRIEPHETDEEYLGTVSTVVSLVESKL
jgi:acyl carrier protein